MRTPLSKQRNKHIQRVLVEAAKLAPRQDHNLALVYESIVGILFLGAKRGLSPQQESDGFNAAFGDGD
jgi:hypothetical protein